MQIRKLLAASLAAAVLSGSLCTMNVSAADFEAYPDTAGTTSAKTEVQIKNLSFYKVSPTKIKLAWSDAKDAQVKTYYLQKYNETTKKWKSIAKANSDGVSNKRRYAYTETLSSSAPQQYKYRVCVVVRDTSRYKAVSGKSQYASNVKVCLDPGHFQNKNGGTYGYSEAQAVLRIGTNLSNYLKREGIDVYMTRTDENITVGGSTNQDDGYQLEARGHMAKNNNCDVFISLHTNANDESANGCDTIQQPSSLNKTIVFVNKVAYNQSSKTVIDMANRMGSNVTKKNKELGIPTTNWLSVSNNGGKPYTYRISNGYDDFTEYNDGLNKKGKAIFRMLNDGQDYYAVLRAAANDGVPGILIEHSFHTVPEFCSKFMNDPDVAKHYALCDARAIGSAFKFKVYTTI